MKKSSSRREFLRVSSLGALGAIVLTQNACRNAGKPAGKTKEASNIIDPATVGVGLQLYTIRDAMAADVPGSLKQVADAGYKYLELANYADGKFYGMEPADFKKLANDLGMEVLSSHSGVEATGITLENAQKMAEDHAKLGVKYCIQPWIVEEARSTLASYKKMASDWNQVGAIMKDKGIQFGYHNHNFEFATVEGQVPYFDVMMAELDKDLVTMEIDLFWTTKAGQNPIDIIKKYPGRFQIYHMKDMYTKKDPYYTTVGEDDFAPVGDGIINFKDILAVKDIAGMKYMVVEQDMWKTGNSMFEAINRSITNIRTKILV